MQVQKSSKFVDFTSDGAMQQVSTNGQRIFEKIFCVGDEK